MDIKICLGQPLSKQMLLTPPVLSFLMWIPTRSNSVAEGNTLLRSSIALRKPIALRSILIRPTLSSVGEVSLSSSSIPKYSSLASKSMSSSALYSPETLPGGPGPRTRFWRPWSKSEGCS
ncbi:UNVERIFIED_CONTAM: hypothetical protein Sangu_3044000 [Sesamum angustifolium]|uniref:Uncharacterized protein n=1 Tax=Sesamum angustifolium TaxID=2727405 RepID=A0AAW2KFQ2_9LAMI